MLPVIVAIPYGNLQGFEPFKDVDDTDDYGGVSNGVVVKVPVDSDFVILVGPQKQSKNLYSAKEVVCLSPHSIQKKRVRKQKQMKSIS